MRGDADRAPFLRCRQQLGGVEAAGWRSVRLVMNATGPEIAFKMLIFVGIKYAQEMHAVFCNGFESTECPQTSFAHGGQKTQGIAYSVVIGYCYDFDVIFDAGFDYRTVVIFLRIEIRYPVVSLELRERIDLQGAPIIPCAVGQIQRNVYLIGACMVETGCNGGPPLLLVSMVH